MRNNNKSELIKSVDYPNKNSSFHQSKKESYHNQTQSNPNELSNVFYSKKPLSSMDYSKNDMHQHVSKLEGDDDDQINRKADDDDDEDSDVSVW